MTNSSDTPPDAQTTVVNTSDARSSPATGIAEIAQGMVQLGNGLASIADGLAKTGHIISPMQDMLTELVAALQEVQKDTRRLGGFKGLLHLARDKDLQRTIQLLKVIPILLDRLSVGQK
ncbi:MAG: hypothetical protein ACREVH_12320 [Gammaproteobacteria bacterium]